ncbi:MAG: porin family protein [Pseudomonadota bacterium]
MNTIRSTKHVCVVAILLCLTNTALAEGQRGFSLSAGIGISTIEDTDDGERFDGESTGFGLDVDYRFSDHFAAGLGIFSLGKDTLPFNGADTTIKVDGTTIFARAILPVSERVDLYGRLGYAVYSVRITPGGSLADLFGENATEAGIGVDVLFTEKLAVRGEGRFLNGPSEEQGSLITVGFSYRF